MKILDNKQITQKVKRLAFEILEENVSVKKLIFLGINNNGFQFAKLLARAYDAISKNPVTLGRTGRTIYYAMKPIMEFVPKKVQAAVLVDRKHKSFPIHVDYVGLSLATTLQENIQVDIKKESSKAAFLQ